MIGHLSYIICDGCGDPAPPADNAHEARTLARAQGFRRVRSQDRSRDLCWRCNPAFADRDHWGEQQR